MPIENPLKVGYRAWTMKTILLSLGILVFFGMIQLVMADTSQWSPDDLYYYRDTRILSTPGGLYNVTYDNGVHIQHILDQASRRDRYVKVNDDGYWQNNWQSKILHVSLGDSMPKQKERDQLSEEEKVKDLEARIASLEATNKFILRLLKENNIHIPSVNLER